MNALISVALCFPQLSHKCTHLTLIKNLRLPLCRVTGVRHLIPWHGKNNRGQGRVSKLEESSGNDKVRKDCGEIREENVQKIKRGERETMS